MESTPPVSIIICTRGRCEELRKTLASLAGVGIPSDLAAELIVIENGEQGEAEALTTSFRHDRILPRYIYEQVPGKSNALNRAVAESAGRILLFTDDDVRVPVEWVVEMCSPLVRGEGEVVVGGCRLAPLLERPWMTDYHRAFLACTQYLSDTDPSEFAGVNMACLRRVFLRVGGFDCELGGGGLGNCEDSLFARQLKQAGCVFIARTRVYVEHHPSVSRLSYASWVRAAACVGRSEAYIIHHWDHGKICWARLRLLYFHLKLFLRRFGRTRSEGIAAWELSYRVDIAKLRYLLRECHRPRNYTLHGLHKLA